jgi:hypothetical protein
MLHDPRSATIVCWHPDAGAQLSMVQGSPSSQLSGLPAVQTPAWHVSTPLQMLLSPHDASERHCCSNVVVVGEMGVVVVVLAEVTVVSGPDHQHREKFHQPQYRWWYLFLRAQQQRF